MASKGKRVSYTNEFKLKVITKAEDVGNREAGRIFSIDESNVRLWRKRKSEIEISNKKRRTNRHGHPLWPELEKELHRWILSEREKGNAVSTTQIRLKARVLAQQNNIDKFEGGPSWCFRFMKRNGLGIRNRTTVGQKLPPDWKMKAEEFHKYCKKLIEDNKFSKEQIINMDEVPLCFDSPPNRTVDSRGEKSIQIITTGHEKTAFTVVLSCAASGLKFPPMVIFKRKTIPKENFPKGIVIRASFKGWMNEEEMIAWLNSVWRKRKGSFFNPKAMLIMDAMKAHIKDSVKNAFKAASAKMAIIPGGLTKKLQPLDIGINRSFKCKVRNLWEKWMTEDNHDYTKTGKIRRASYAQVCEWVKKAWDDVTEETIKRSFEKAKIIDENLENYDSTSSEDDNDCALDEEILKLFDSESDDSEFEGFE